MTWAVQLKVVLATHIITVIVAISSYDNSIILPVLPPTFYPNKEKPRQNSWVGRAGIRAQLDCVMFQMSSVSVVAAMLAVLSIATMEARFAFPIDLCATVHRNVELF